MDERTTPGISFILVIVLMVVFSFLSGCGPQRAQEEKAKKLSSDKELPAEKEATMSKGVEEEERENFTLSSPAFKNGERLEVRFARSGVPGGKNLSPPLQWSNIPGGTKSLALICVDRHPVANNWIHWVVINIPPSVQSLPEGASPEKIPEPAKELGNTFGYGGYGGPQPPPGSGVHDYEFTIYALSVERLEIPSSPTIEKFYQAIAGKVIAKATLIGKFSQ